MDKSANIMQLHNFLSNVNLTYLLQRLKYIPNGIPKFSFYTSNLASITYIGN